MIGDTIPADGAWDGFGFSREPTTGQVCFLFFDDNVKQHGALPGPPDVPTDRVMYHVLLQHYIKGEVRIESPFTSCFTDALVYAAHLAHSGFSGFMIKVNQLSLALAQSSIRETVAIHSALYGFWAVNPDTGKDHFYPGRKKRPQPKKGSIS